MDFSEFLLLSLGVSRPPGFESAVDVSEQGVQFFFFGRRALVGEDLWVFPEHASSSGVRSWENRRGH